jgi:hypothetical protein
MQNSTHKVFIDDGDWSFVLYANIQPKAFDGDAALKAMFAEGVNVKIESIPSASAEKTIGIFSQSPYGMNWLGMADSTDDAQAQIVAGNYANRDIDAIILIPDVTVHQL